MHVCLQALPGLQRLNLSQTAASDKALKALAARCASLVELDCDHCGDVSDAGALCPRVCVCA